MVMILKQTAGKNVTFEVAKMSETAFETQAAYVTHGVGEEALSSLGLRLNS